MSQSPSKSQIILIVLPLIVYTLAEEFGGLLWGLSLAIIYAVAEVSWEFFKFRRVSNISLISNGLVIGLSAISFFSQEGFWFKLQPAILELFMGGLFWVTHFMKKPFLLELIRSQNHDLLQQEPVKQFIIGLNFRLGVFFFVQTAIAIYAAYYFSTPQWAFLKSIGVILMMAAYLIVETLLFKRRFRSN